MTTPRFASNARWASAREAKSSGQILVSVTFAVLAVSFPDSDGQTPAAPGMSLVRNADLIDFSQWGQVGVLVGFAVWATLIIVGTSNAVNLTDGLDGPRQRFSGVGLCRLCHDYLLAVQSVMLPGIPG